MSIARIVNVLNLVVLTLFSQYELKTFDYTYKKKKLCFPPDQPYPFCVAF